MEFKTYQLLFLVFCISFNLQAQVDSSWKKKLSAYGLSSKSHCFCYKNPEGDVHSTCPKDEHWSIASVSKVMTSLYLMDRFGANYRFSTEVLIDKALKRVHIKGGGDPVLQQSVLAYIIKELNTLGITSLKEVSFDSNFAFGVENYSEAQNKSLVKDSSYVRGTAKWALNYYMNQPKKVALNLKKELEAILARKRALEEEEAHRKGKGDVTIPEEEFVEEQEGVRSILDEDHIAELEKLIEELEFTEMKVENVEFREQPDFNFERRIIYKSAKLIDILKFFNTHSINGIGDYVFSRVGRDKFRSFFENYFNWNNPLLYNGSGLPYYSGRTRYENRVSCVQVLQGLESLKNASIEYGYKPYDFLATAQRDGGTLRKRFLNTRYNFATSIWAKTGTINSVSAIAGFLETKRGQYIFSLLGRGRVSTMKKFEESWLDTFAGIVGGLKGMSYSPKGFERIVGDIEVE